MNRRELEMRFMWFNVILFTLLTLALIFTGNKLYHFIYHPHTMMMHAAVKHVSIRNKVLPSEEGIIIVSNGSNTQITFTKTELESLVKLSEKDGYIVLKIQRNDH